MTPDQQKNYEEAAKAYKATNGSKPDSGQAFLDGANFGSKEAHNEAIDKAIKLFKTRGSFGTPFVDELEKLKL